MNTFKELSPEEQKLALIQFLGQHVTGELKEIDKNLISSSASLRASNIDPASLVRSIPSSPNPVATVVNAGINVTNNRPEIAQPTRVQQIEVDLNNHSNPLLEKLDKILTKLDEIVVLLKKD